MLSKDKCPLYIALPALTNPTLSCKDKIPSAGIRPGDLIMAGKKITGRVIITSKNGYLLLLNKDFKYAVKTCSLIFKY